MKRMVAVTATVVFLSLHAAAQTSPPDAVIDGTDSDYRDVDGPTHW